MPLSAREGLAGRRGPRPSAASSSSATLPLGFLHTPSSRLKEVGEEIAEGNDGARPAAHTSPLGSNTQRCLPFSFPLDAAPSRMGPGTRLRHRVLPFPRPASLLPADGGVGGALPHRPSCVADAGGSFFAGKGTGGCARRSDREGSAEETSRSSSPSGRPADRRGNGGPLAGVRGERSHTCSTEGKAEDTRDQHGVLRGAEEEAPRATVSGKNGPKESRVGYVA